jgi:hypothetical protein
MNGPSGACRRLAKQAEEGDAVDVVSHDRAAVDAAGGDVVNAVGHVTAAHAWHLPTVER